MLAKPRAWAAANLEELGRLAAEGRDIVCVEPSCLSTLRDDYGRLLETTPFAGDSRLEILEGRSYDVTEYLVLGAREGWSRLRLAAREAEFVVHGHCHQKSLGLGSAPADAMRLIPGVTVHEVEALCCGMVGSFGYKAEYSELSSAIGSDLSRRLDEHPGQIVTCGISCRTQIELGTGRPVVHPVEVLAEAARPPGEVSR